MTVDALYNIFVTTSNKPLAGTDANVYLTIYGVKKATEKLHLKSSKTNTNAFEQGKTDHFEVKAPYVGLVEKIKIEHDNSKFGSGWHLDKIIIQIKDTNEQYFFTCNRWLDKNEDDKQIARILYPTREQEKCDITSSSSELVTYNLKVKTSNQSSASKNAQIFIQIFGLDNKTEKIYLTDCSNNKIPFQAGNIDSFVFRTKYLNGIQSIQVGHLEGSFIGEWNLEAIQIAIKEKQQEVYLFECDQWYGRQKDKLEYKFKVARPNEDKMTTYKVTVTTSDIQLAGTDANVFIQMYSSNLKTEKIPLKQSKTNKNPFEKGKIDVFELEAQYIGQIEKIKIGHDGTKLGAGWHLKSVKLEVLEDNQTYLFDCNTWLDKKEGDGLIERYFEPLDNGNKTKREQTPLTRYLISVHTGDCYNAGTQSNVSLILYGKKGQTDEISLSRTHDETFSRNQVDKFLIEYPCLGNISKMKLRHDNSGKAPDWFCKMIEIQVMNEKVQEKYIFICNKWLSLTKDDKVIERILYEENFDGKRDQNHETIVEKLPKSIKKNYFLKIYTSSKSNKFFDSNVYLTLFGDKNVTKETKLKKSMSHDEKYSKNQIDVFKLEFKDLGTIFALALRHDNLGFHNEVLIEKIEVVDENYAVYEFNCDGEWLSTRKQHGFIHKIFSEKYSNIDLFL